MTCRNHPDVAEGLRACSRCRTLFCGDCLVDVGGEPYCGACKRELLLDIRSGLDDTLDYASFGRRFVALWLDSFVIGIPGLVFIFGTLDLARRQPRFIFFSPVYFLLGFAGVIYQAAMLAARGQTLGKIAVKIKVVRLDGSDITSGQAWGRELARMILGFLYIVDWPPVFFTKDRRSVHDMLAKTRVVNWW
jgi:uncharacterized RDD family membrane protein YckC